MKGILIDQESCDIELAGGRIALGDNRLQSVEQILISNRGEYKEHPLVGGEVQKMIHGNVSRFWPNRVRAMCKAMGVSLSDLQVRSDNCITIKL